MQATESWKRLHAEARRAGYAAECSQRRRSEAGWPGPSPDEEASGADAADREEFTQEAHE